MSTLFTWSGRLLDAAGNAAAGATLEVEIFDLGASKWIAVSQAVSAADGGLRGRGEIGDDTLPFAPALRLSESGAVMATTPAISKTARGGISVDFGEVRRAPVATPFIRTVGRGAAPFAIGGATTAAATSDMAAMRAEVMRDFSTQLALREQEVADRDARLTDVQRNLAERDMRLADAQRLVMDRDARLSDALRAAADRESRLTEAQRLVADRDAALAENVRKAGEKDAEIRRLSNLMAAKDQEILALRQAGPPAAVVDVASIRAETSQVFAEKMAALDRDLADRDGQIKQREAKLAETIRLADSKDAEIRRLKETIADKDRIIASPISPQAEASSVTRVSDFATSIGGQLDDAQTALKSRGFSLGNIEINAKGLLQDEGRKVEILDREAMKTVQPGALADLKFSFVPDKPPSGLSGQTVPDLMFLTESRARAVLASLGLLLDASAGPASLNTRAAPGQAMLQTPAAGAQLPRGGRVNVIFAAAKE